MSSALSPTIEAPDIKVAKPGMFKRLMRNPSVLIGGALLLLIALMGVCAPLLTSIDPAEIDPSNRNMMPGHESTVRDDDGNKIQRVALMGTDSLGRDIYSRVVYGARVSLIVGIAVAVLSVAVGLVIGLVAGYFRWLDGVIMRIMDGLMAIPCHPRGHRAGVPVRCQPADGDRGRSPSPRYRAWCGWCARSCCRSARSPMSRRRSRWAPPRPRCCGAMCCPTPSRR
jgi:hypothetical protein